MARRSRTSGPATALPTAVAVAPEVGAALIAPWPQSDRFPLVLGSHITLQTISSALRMGTSGQRRELVDLLDELLERDPSTYAALCQRVLVLAGARLDVTPPELPADDSRVQRAQEIADEVRRRINGIADLRASIQSLAWALYYGPTGAEIAWDRAPDGWHPRRLHFLHSRRIAYPDPFSWSPAIVDSSPLTGGSFRTIGAYGLPLDAYPGKFILHVPQVRGDYPTRDGLGRQLVYWMALKGMAARSATQYLERFGKPWAYGKYTTNGNGTGTPIAASPDDITKAMMAVQGLGQGTLSGAVLPDSVALEIKTASATGGLTHDQFLDLCDEQIITGIRGSTFTSRATKYGSRSVSDTAKVGEREIARYDAGCLGDTLQRDLVDWIVRLSWPDETDLTPRLRLHVDEEPGAPQVLDLAVKAAGAGIPVDADAIAKRIGLPVVPPEPGAPPRRMHPLKASGDDAPTPEPPDTTTPPGARDPQPAGEGNKPADESDDEPTHPDAEGDGADDDPTDD